MPTTVKVRIYGARNLPNVTFHHTAAAAAVVDEAHANRSIIGQDSLTTVIPIMDAFCTVTLGGHYGLVTDGEEPESVTAVHPSILSINPSAEMSIANKTTTNNAGDSLEPSYSGDTDMQTQTSNKIRSPNQAIDDLQDTTLWQKKSSRTLSISAGRVGGRGLNILPTTNPGMSGTKSSRGRRVFAARTKIASAELVSSSSSRNASLATITTAALPNAVSSNTDHTMRQQPPSTILQWDEEFRFDVADDTVLQDEPLIFKVFDTTSTTTATASATAATTSSNRRFQTSMSRTISFNTINTSNVSTTSTSTSTTSAASTVPWGGEDIRMGGDFSSSTSTTSSSSSSIGLVYVDLNPLLTLISNEDTSSISPSTSIANNTNLTTSSIMEESSTVPTKITSISRNTSTSSSTHSHSKRSLSGGSGTTHTSNTLLHSTITPSSPLNTSHRSIDGWFPLYDTLGGVRGELGLSIKVQFIGDVNPFRDSSAGVQLFPFSTLDPASGYTVSHVYGFVEELVVADDPEFDLWTGGFSLNQVKTSHESRQTLMYLLDASVRRRMCKKVLEV